jgi:hypothetical protein
MSFDPGSIPPGVPFDLGNSFFYDAEISGYLILLISHGIFLPFSIIVREHPSVPGHLLNLVGMA